VAESRIPWARIVLEGAVIVASILLAFALDAWWDARSQRADLLEDLASVTEEVQANRDALALETLFHETAVSSIDDLVARIDTAGEAAWLTLPDTIVSFAIVFPPIVDVSTGALDALVVNGDLARVRDARLQRILGDLGAQFADVVDGELGARRLATEELVPLFWDTPELESALGRSVDYRARGLGDAPIETRDIRIPKPAGLKNRLLLRRAWIASTVRSIDRVRASLDEALVLLESEMERE